MCYHYTTRKYARMIWLEQMNTVLETAVLPLHYTRICGDNWFRTSLLWASTIRFHQISFISKWGCDQIRTDDFTLLQSVTFDLSATQPFEPSVRLELTLRPHYKWGTLTFREEMALCRVDRTRTCIILASRASRLPLPSLLEIKNPFLLGKGCVFIDKNYYTYKPSLSVLGHWVKGVFHVCWRLFIMQR